MTRGTRRPSACLWLLSLGCSAGAHAPQSHSKTPPLSETDTGRPDVVSPSPPSGDGSVPTDTAQDTGLPSDTAEAPEDSGDPSDGSAYHGEPLDPPWPVPDFSVSDQHGALHTNNTLLGRPTVLWFFRDTASACTNDACGYRDLQTDFDALDVQIIAVGPTSVEANAAWAAALEYQYTIWSDTDGVLAEAYGVESPFDEGNLRHAFLLDPMGHAVLRHEGAVSVGADPREVLADAAQWLADAG